MITWRVSPESILDTVEIARVEKVVALLGLEACKAIDSYQMSADGPKVSTIFLVNKDYLAEVRVTGSALEFDVCAARSIMNIRVTFENKHVQSATATGTVDSQPSADNAVTEAASVASVIAATELKYVTIDLRHTDKLHSRLSYFNSNVDDWVRFVLDAYPKSLLLSG